MRRALQGALAGLTPAIVVRGADALPLAPDPAPLGAGRGFAVSLALFVGPAPAGDRPRRYTARTVAYSYVLRDRDGRELVAYHRHPVGRSLVVWPHVHIGTALLRPDAAGRFARLHLPTEPVAATAFLRAAVADLGVVPLRDDWRARLDAADILLRASFA